MRQRIAASARVLLLSCALSCAGIVMAEGSAEPSSTPMKMLIEVPSPLGFEETLERLEANAKALGWKVPSKWKVDFQRNLQRVTGTDIGPNRVIKMCEPFAAAELLVKDEYKMLTAMMPCTIAVFQKSDGKTYVAMMNLEMMGQMFGGDVKGMAAALSPQMDQMLNFD